MFWNYYNFILLFLWQLPQNIVALLIYPFLGKKKVIKNELYTKVYECSKMNGGISLGNFIFVSPENAKKETAIIHEYGHVLQSHYLGWLYLFIISIPSLANTIVGFKDCYYEFWTESWANKISGLKTSRNQHGCFIYLPKK